MKLGINVRNFGPSATPEALLGWARFAEDAGFSMAMMSDHVASTPDVNATYPAPFYDPFTTLSWLAGLTSTLELGTTVSVLPFRNPLLTARVVANIDQFSRGRFILGVGVGWSKPESDALGVPFDRRGPMTDEYLDVIKAFWTKDLVSKDGEYVSFHAIRTGPKPVQSPHPPIWVGGSVRPAIRRAARYGDAWHPINENLTWLRTEGLPALREAAMSMGRPTPALCPRMQIRLTGDHISGEDRTAGSGALTQILKDLDTLASMGARYLVLDTNPDDPHDRRPVTDDWHILEKIAKHWPS